MEDLIIAILQFLLETLLEGLSIFPIGWATPPGQLNSEERWGRGLASFLLGMGIGALSIWLFGHSLIKFPALRIANLLIAPILSGYFAKGIATYRRRGNSRIIPQRRFWYAFWFTLGVVLTRFIWASRQ